MLDSAALNTLVQFGTGGAVILCVVLFLRFLRHERAQMHRTIQNHLDHNTKAMDDLAAGIHALATAVQDLKGHCERIHMIHQLSVSREHDHGHPEQ